MLNMIGACYVIIENSLDIDGKNGWLSVPHPISTGKWGIEDQAEVGVENRHILIENHVPRPNT